MVRGVELPGPGTGIPAAAACMAATIWANKAAPAGRGPRGPGGPAGPTGPTGPTGPAGPGMGGGRGGGMGAAILKTQCNNKLNPTLLVDNWLIL